MLFTLFADGSIRKKMEPRALRLKLQFAVMDSSEPGLRNGIKPR